MRLKIAVTAFALLLTCAGRAGAQEFPWQEYRTRTFAEMVKGNAADAAASDARNDGKTSVLFSGDPAYSQVRVTYTGTTRKVAGARRTHVDEWAATFGLKPEIAALYESE